MYLSTFHQPQADRLCTSTLLEYDTSADYNRQLMDN